MERQDNLMEQSTGSEDDIIHVVESTIESDLSTGGSKDENENRKEQRTIKVESRHKRRTEFLDLPDSLIKHILRFIPSSPFEKKPSNHYSRIVSKRFCSPNATNNGCNVHGGVGGTCKRLHRLSSERKSKFRPKKDIVRTNVELPIRHLEIPIGQEQLRLTYGDDNPSEKWTYCYNSIDKIIRY